MICCRELASREKFRKRNDMQPISRTIGPARQNGPDLLVNRRQAVAGIGIAVAGWMFGESAWSRTAAIPSGRFGFAGPDVPEGFLLDGKPFQIRSGELHPARIPREYWLHRIRMAKAMGLNTIAIYVMWNHHEREPGAFDFESDNRNIASFINLCAAEGMIVYLRGGPYVCAEWELGGIPAYLLRTPGIRLRHREDHTYMAACERYISKLASIVHPMMIDRGGPIAMVQIENEYASFGNDTEYLRDIRKMWIDAGIIGPFSISDGLEQIEKSNTYLDGAALGLDGNTNFSAARSIAGNSPVWIGEGYPGWLTHWGDSKFAHGYYGDTLRTLMRERRSFNLYVVHGGTNFGFGAGANAEHDGSKFEPILTSYDYGAPINECGAPTRQYHMLRKIIADATDEVPVAIPDAPALISFPKVRTAPQGSLWGSLPKPVRVETPGPMELVLGQTQGLILYRHDLSAFDSGLLQIDGLHDEALILLDGMRIGFLSRVAAAGAPSGITIPPGEANAVRRLDILVFPYGRVNYGHYMKDRKGILGDVTINQVKLQGWSVFGLPLDDSHLARLRRAPVDESARALLHEADIQLDETGDTFIDMSEWKLGYVWVNGHMLGRHSALGPQTRLYCPESWLRRGRNRITVLDLYAETGLSLKGLTVSNIMEQNA